MSAQRSRAWLKSLGGPLIAVPRSVVPSWWGTDGPGGDDDIDEEETDYWRACMAPEPVGVIDISGEPALVLRTSSVPTTYVGEHLLFVHEMARVARDTVAGAVELIPDVHWQGGCTFSVHEQLILFDASFPGSYALNNEHLLIDIPFGEYSVESVYWKPIAPDDVWVTMVRLR